LAQRTVLQLLGAAILNVLSTSVPPARDRFPVGLASTIRLALLLAEQLQRLFAITLPLVGRGLPPELGVLGRILRPRAEVSLDEVQEDEPMPVTRLESAPVIRDPELVLEREQRDDLLRDRVLRLLYEDRRQVLIVRLLVLLDVLEDNLPALLGELEREALFDAGEDQLLGGRHPVLRDGEDDPDDALKAQLFEMQAVEAKLPFRPVVERLHRAVDQVDAQREREDLLVVGDLLVREEARQVEDELLLGNHEDALLGLVEQQLLQRVTVDLGVAQRNLLEVLEH